MSAETRQYAETIAAARARRAHPPAALTGAAKAEAVDLAARRAQTGAVMLAIAERNEPPAAKPAPPSAAR